MLAIRTFGPTVRSHHADRYSPAASNEQSDTQSVQDKVELTAARAQEIESGLGERIPGQVLVKVSSDLTSEQMKKLASEYGATIQQEIRVPDVMKETFAGKLLVLDAGPGLSEAQTMAMLEQDSRVLMSATNDQLQMIDSRAAQEQVLSQEQPPAEPTEKLPNDLHPEQWGLRSRNYPGGIDGADIQAGKAWTITTGKGVEEGGPIVAIVDSGVDAFHEDLKANMWTNPREEKNGKDDDWDGFTDDMHGIDATNGTGNIYDEIGHGTHVAGIVGAVSNNGKGVAGVNWDTQLMGVKIVDGNRLSLLGAITGILYASENGARIANHSWGGRVNNPILEDVMATSPMLHVCAAGNGQRDADKDPSYPAAYDLPNVISVGGSARKDEHLFLSNWGVESVDVHAPGALIYSTTPIHNYEDMSGTSMSAPHVSGVAALIASKFPEASNQEIKDRILYSADKKEDLRDKSVSGGRLNAFRSLEVDEIGPAPVTDLRLKNLTSDGFELDWTGTGDDGMEGVLSQYNVWAEFGDQKERLIPTFPKGPGAKETVSFRTLPVEGDRPLKVSLTPVDNVGNRANPAIVTSTIPTASVPFLDNLDAETGWTAEAEWAKVEEEGRGLVFTDSPNGKFKDSVDNGIISPTFDLTDMRSATLTFDAKLLADKWDFVWVEAKTKDAEDYEHLGLVKTDGESGREWNKYRFDLSALDGQKDVQLRVRFRTSNKGTDDGVYVDNFKVESALINQGE